MVEAYGELLQEEDLIPIASSLVVTNSADLLLEISGELHSRYILLANVFKRLDVCCEV
jgi:hypothetical protein